MIRATIGLTMWAGMMLTPLAHAVAMELFPEARIWFAAGKLLIAYTAAALIVVVFLRRTNLARRLPTPTPGLTTISFGIALAVLTPAVIAVLLSNQLPNPFYRLVEHGLTMYPGLLVLTAGCAQLLLAARPRSSVEHPGAAN